MFGLFIFVFKFQILKKHFAFGKAYTGNFQGHGIIMWSRSRYLKWHADLYQADFNWNFLFLVNSFSATYVI